MMPDEQSRPEGAAGVAGRGLDPDPLKRTLAQQPAVAHAVQGHAASKAEVFQTGLRVEVPRNAEVYLLCDLLH